METKSLNDAQKISEMNKATAPATTDSELQLVNQAQEQSVKTMIKEVDEPENSLLSQKQREELEAANNEDFIDDIAPDDKSLIPDEPEQSIEVPESLQVTPDVPDSPEVQEIQNLREDMYDYQKDNLAPEQRMKHFLFEEGKGEPQKNVSLIYHDDDYADEKAKLDAKYADLEKDIYGKGVVSDTFNKTVNDSMKDDVKQFDDVYEVTESSSPDDKQQAKEMDDLQITDKSANELEAGKSDDDKIKEMNEASAPSHNVSANSSVAALMNKYEQQSESYEQRNAAYQEQLDAKLEYGPKASKYM